MRDAEIYAEDNITIETPWQDERPQSAFCYVSIECISICSYNIVRRGSWPSSSEVREEDLGRHGYDFPE